MSKSFSWRCLWLICVRKLTYASALLPSPWTDQEEGGGLRKQVADINKQIKWNSQSETLLVLRRRQWHNPSVVWHCNGNVHEYFMETCCVKMQQTSSLPTQYAKKKNLLYLAKRSARLPLQRTRLSFRWVRCNDGILGGFVTTATNNRRREWSD